MERETLVKKIIMTIVFCVVGILLPFILQAPFNEFLFCATKTHVYLFVTADVCLFAIAGIFVNVIAKGMSKNIKISFITLCIRELVFVLLGVLYNAIIIINRIHCVYLFTHLEVHTALGIAFQWGSGYYINLILYLSTLMLFIIIYIGFLVFNLYRQWNKVRNNKQTQY